MTVSDDKVTWCRGDKVTKSPVHLATLSPCHPASVPNDNVTRCKGDKVSEIARSPRHPVTPSPCHPASP